jgi:hypothetical protein
VYLARSAAAALEALRRSNVPFRRAWQPPRLAVWEGPFSDQQRLPQEPGVAAQRRKAQRAWRERRKRASEAAKSVAQRDAAAGGDVAA